MEEIVVIGISHQTAPVGVREQLSFTRPSPEPPLYQLLGREEISGAVMLSTCNRIEIYASTRRVPACRESLEEFLSRWGSVSRSELSSWTYFLSGPQAAEHIFRVASSLDSMIPGEPQILGQVKQAYLASLYAQAVDPLINHLFQRSFSVAKRIRRETGIGRLGVSVSSVAIEFIRRRQPNLADRMVILIGAGEMAEQAAKALFESGVRGVEVTNRTYQRSVEVANRIGGKAFQFEDLPRLLPEADVIIASTFAPHYILTRQSLASALAGREKPLFVIDISVPRCLDPEIARLESVVFADIDHLQELGAENLKSRMAEAKKAEALIERETEKFSLWLRERTVSPLISSIHEWAEEIRKQELSRTLRRLGSHNGFDPVLLDRLTRSLVKRILQPPTRRLRQEAAGSTQSSRIRAFSSLFELEIPPPSKSPGDKEK